MTTAETRAAILHRIGEEVRARRRFLVTSHARPDGDSIGSQLALAFALRQLGKEVRVVNRDPAPPHYRDLPGVCEIEIAGRVDGACDALFVMECGDLRRPDIDGLDGCFVINIDHHPGNTAYGAINWFDETAAACAEMVFDLVASLNVRLTPEIATLLYLAILTDTGSFHFSGVSPRTFDICRQLLEAGADPVRTACTAYDTNSVARLRLLGAVLGRLTLEASDRIAVLHLDPATAAEAGATDDDTEGFINIPLSVPHIQAVVFFKKMDGDEYRVSLRSKGNIDVSRVAKELGGGGHRNAAGCAVPGPIEHARPLVLRRVAEALEQQPGPAR